MTQGQIDAIRILNSLRDANPKPLTEDEYFFLMDFVVRQEKVCMQYIQPYTPPQPFYQKDQDMFMVTCDGDNRTVTSSITNNNNK